MELLYFAVWCRPFGQYFAVPTHSGTSVISIKGNNQLMMTEQCSAATNHLITNAIFNISSDLIILSIPMPLLFKVRLPMKNKVVLVSDFTVQIICELTLTFYPRLGQRLSHWRIHVSSIDYSACVYR
jgi:hypothetical protein